MSEHRFEQNLKPKTLCVKDLHVDPSYQRPVKQNLLRWIAENFDEVAFGRLLVAERKDGTFWVVDGQQRLAGATKKCFDKVPCNVFESLGRQQEAAIFNEVNSKRVAVSSLEKFKALLESRDEEAIAINAAVENVGFHIGKGGGMKNPKTVQSVAVLQEVYKRGGTELIKTTLRILRATWPNNFQATCSQMLWGMSLFCDIFKGEYEERRLINKLYKDEPLEILQYVKNVKKFSTGSKGRIVMEAIMNKYDQGAKGRRLRQLLKAEDKIENDSEEVA